MGVLLANDFWNRKRVTAQRVRQRIGAVMQWAVAQGHREDNPAGDAISGGNFRRMPCACGTSGRCHTPRLGLRWTGSRASDALASTKLALEFSGAHGVSKR